MHSDGDRLGTCPNHKAVNGMVADFGVHPRRSGYVYQDTDGGSWSAGDSRSECGDRVSGDGDDGRGRKGG